MVVSFQKSSLFLCLLTILIKPGTVWAGNSWNPSWNEPIVQAHLPEALNPPPKDIEEVCPHYQNLSRDDQEQFWIQFFKSLAQVESGFSLNARMVETSMGKDAVTGKQIVSEGLLQLSYQDQKYYGCDFDWATDKPIDEANPKDLRKTIFDPFKNLRCGMIIFKRVTLKRGAIFTRSYWAPLLEARSNSAYKAFMKALFDRNGMCR